MANLCIGLGIFALAYVCGMLREQDETHYWRDRANYWFHRFEQAERARTVHRIYVVDPETFHRYADPAVSLSSSGREP